MKPSGSIPTALKPGATKVFALARLGKYDEAIKAYDEAIRLDPNLTGTWNNKGNVLEAMGRTNEADAAFARAKELEATEPGLLSSYPSARSRPRSPMDGPASTCARTRDPAACSNHLFLTVQSSHLP